MAWLIKKAIYSPSSIDSDERAERVERFDSALETSKGRTYFLATASEHRLCLSLMQLLFIRVTDEVQSFAWI